MNYTLEGDLRMGGTVALDNTLTLNSAAAQAKATGDAIKVVRESIDNHKADTKNPHGVTKEQLGLYNVDNTSDENKPVSKAQAAAIADAKKAGTDAQAVAETKVTAEDGKGLSTNDFTDAYKTKLDGIAEGANKYVMADKEVTTAKIADKAVTTAKLADGSVTAEKVAFTYQTPLSSDKTRTIHVSTAEPTASNGSNGDLWFVYE